MRSRLRLVCRWRPSRAVKPEEAGGHWPALTKGAFDGILHNILTGPRLIQGRIARHEHKGVPVSAIALIQSRRQSTHAQIVRRARSRGRTLGLSLAALSAVNLALIPRIDLSLGQLALGAVALAALCALMADVLAPPNPLRPGWQRMGQLLQVFMVGYPLQVLALQSLNSGQSEAVAPLVWGAQATLITIVALGVAAAAQRHHWRLLKDQKNVK